ncbi:MAG: winged helix-turn-helix domain-containing protein [Caldilineales bacterium]|nr:winged helix-turn-helix domain-containing protein [Caldilineales bacterium]MCW5859422.1 winged helix-turn-helix transcriptional regulator [Caldilineales bacterium]
MHALIICEEQRLAELLTVALRQVGLRGIVRRTPPPNSHQLGDVSVLVVDVSGVKAALAALHDLRTLTSAPVLVHCPPADEESLLDLYLNGATLVALKPSDLRLVAAQALALSRVASVIPAMPAPHPLLDPETQSIVLPAGHFRLSTLEYRLLATLLSRPGRVFPLEALVEAVWGYSGDGDRHLVKGLVNRVRRKIEPAPQEPIYLLTEAGVGYRFAPPPAGDDGPPPADELGEAVGRFFFAASARNGNGGEGVARESSESGGAKFEQSLLQPAARL